MHGIWIAAALVLLNALSFGLMAYDKQCARKSKRRIPEKILFLSAACFGALGGVMGMQLCRHKTKHWYFRVFFPVLLILQIAALALFFMPRAGAEAAARESQPCVLSYSSFDGGGAAYRVSIADETVLACETRYDYGGQDPELIEGASYDVYFTLIGLKQGETAVTVRWDSPILDSGEAHFTATVDEKLNVKLEKEPAMNVQIYDRCFTAALEDNETARAFAALLPMTLHMTELNGNEKYHYLMSGLPASPQRVGRIEKGDIMLFGDDCVVLFYQSFDTPYSYTRIGKIADTEQLEQQLAGDWADVVFSPQE